MFERLVDDDLTVSWIFDRTGVPEPTSYEVSWKNTTTDTPETVVSLEPTIDEFTISDIDAEMRYEINVVAIYDGEERYVGQIALWLNVPGEPKIESIETTETSIMLRWKAPILNTGFRHWPVDGYELSWGRSEVGTPRTTVALGEDVREHRIDGLLSGTSYDLSLFAKNGLGNGDLFSTSATTDKVAPTPMPTPTSAPTPTPTFTPTPTPTQTAMPSPTPLPDSIIVQFDSLTDDGAKVRWHFAGSEQVEPTGYEVRWRLETSNVEETSGLLPPTVTAYSVPNIEAKITYDIQVAAFYNGTELSAKIISLRFDIPVEPKLEIETDTETSLRVKWDLPAIEPTAIIQRPVAEYELSWQKDAPDAKVVSVVLAAGIDSYTITQLSPVTEYKVSLRARSLLGDYAQTDVLVINTDPPIVIPIHTPTSTPTVLSTPTVTSTAHVTSNTPSRNKRDADPDPPEEFDAEQGNGGIVVYWDNPRWDGGSDIRAYAVDWHPESPPFPLFLPSTERSKWIYGLKPGVNYRMRVKAFNHNDDSLPATLRIKLTDTLVRHSNFAPFTGSISNGRSTVLKNNFGLPGFEIQTDPKSLFWGDEMAFSIKRHLTEEELNAEMVSQQFAAASDLFTVVASPHSRRSRFDNGAAVYQFVMPIVICIEPNLLNSAPIHTYSIVQIFSPTDIRVFDSAPVHEADKIKLCARIREIDVNTNVTFAVISNQRAWKPSTDSTRPEEGVTRNAAIALVMFLVGPTFIVGGVAVLRQSNRLSTQST